MKKLLILILLSFSFSFLSFSINRNQDVSKLLENIVLPDGFKIEIYASDVAKAFVFQAKLTKTTGNIITVDGGNIEASLR